MTKSVVEKALEGKKQFLPPTADKSDDLEYDLGNLMASDAAPVDEKKYKSKSKAYLDSLSRDNTQLLVNKLFDLPSEPADVGRLAVLPPTTTITPREKPLPKDKPKTKWEQFAEEKGIQKKKKDRMVWDDEQKEWRPRFGYKRVHDIKDEVIVEAKPGDDPNVDPFEKMSKEKKERKAKNEKQQLKNLQRAANEGIVPATLGLTKNLPSAAGGGPVAPLPKKDMKDTVSSSLGVAQISTASMGKFDNKLDGEKNLKAGKKRKFEPVVPSGNERERTLDIVSKVLGKDEAVVNVKKAVNQENIAKKTRTSNPKKGAQSKAPPKRPPKGQRGGKPNKKGK